MPRKKTYSDDLFDAGLVVGARLPMLALGAVAPTPAVQQEAMLMVSEKVMANALGVVAAQCYMVSVPQRLMKNESLFDIFGGIMNAYAGPARRTVRDNAKRLQSK